MGNIPTHKLVEVAAVEVSKLTSEGMCNNNKYANKTITATSTTAAAIITAYFIESIFNFNNDEGAAAAAAAAAAAVDKNDEDDDDYKNSFNICSLC